MLRPRMPPLASSHRPHSATRDSSQIGRKLRSVWTTRREWASQHFEQLDYRFLRQEYSKESMMTMDVHRRCVETSTPYLSNGGGGESGSSPRSDRGGSPATKPVPSKPPTKRSFDVAFLMAPDDSSKKRHHEEELKQQLRLVTTASLMPGYSPPPMPHQSYDTPLGLLMPTLKHYPKEDRVSPQGRSQFAKSAFTKVSNVGRAEITVVPPVPVSPSSSTVSGGAVSPDIGYRESSSPSSSRGRSPVQYLSITKPVNYFNGKPSAPSYLYQKQTRSSPEEQSSLYQSTYLSKLEEKASGSKGKHSVYPGEVLPYAVPYGFPGGFPGPGGQVPALLTAAANVTAALLPPSLAALTLPAQNVCAKCNVSFRMTSDLVYHMRSQHKNDAVLGESSRRRREQDKLRCPVCNETFRERHHLTRHMTAHQDKEGDSVDEEEDSGRRRAHTQHK